MSELDKALRWLERSPFVCREPVYRLTIEQIEELKQMLAEYRKRIDDEIRASMRNDGGAGTTGAGRRSARATVV